MLNFKKNIMLPAIFMTMSLPAWSIDNTVVATIDGKNVVAEELALTAQQNKIDYKTLNNSQKSVLLSGLINRVIVADEARKMMLDQEPMIKLRLKALVDSVLAASMLEKKTRDIKISETTLQKFYNDNVANNKQYQYKASHILVKEKSLADSLSKQLKSGKDFATLAKANSIDKGSAEKGGDLGWFNPTTMVPSFSAAVKKASKGKVTDPVQSQFGWHIILVEDSKPITPPSFADSKEKIRELLIKQQVSQYIESLKKKHKVESKLGK